MKKFESKKKKLVFTHEVKGIGPVKTSCKTFGSPITKGATLELVSLCASCAESDEVKHACLLKSGKLKIEKKTGARGGRKGPRGPSATESENPFAIVTIGLSKGYTKEKIVKRMTDNGVSEANAKNKYGSVSCCYRALIGESQKEGAVARYAKWILSGRKGDAPVIDASSRSYTEKVYSVMVQYKILKPVKA